MKLLSNFENASLTRDEMKNIKGGTCRTWSIGLDGKTHYSNTTYSKSGAKQEAAWLVQNYGAGYGWCCGSGCS